jgi:hypothetical protein
VLYALPISSSFLFLIQCTVAAFILFTYLHIHPLLSN